MKRHIKIDDTLQDRIDSAIEDVKAELLSYCEDNSPDSLPCISNDLDYSGAIHEIIDGSVPIYTKEIDDTFYLYGSEIEEAFDDAGIGDKNDENWPMGWKPAAIYCYIEQKIHEWYRNEAEEVFDEWKRQQAVKGMEFFFMGREQFLNAEEGSWMAERMTENLPENADDTDRLQEAISQEGWYYWNCQPGCMPDSDANGPFETEQEAHDDCVANAPPPMPGILARAKKLLREAKQP